jgi:DNA helicase MCM9
MQCIFSVEQMLPAQYVELMIGYLEAHHLQQVVEILTELDCATSRHYSVPIALSEVMAWDGPKGAWLGTMLVHHTETLLPYFDDAIRELQKTLIASHEEREFMAYKPSVHARLCRLPQCGALRKETVSSLRADDVNRLVQVPGTVIRTGQLKMLQVEKEYECAKCRFRFKCRAELEQRHQMALPSECIHSAGGGLKVCGGNRFELVPGSEACHDYQEVRIQEQARSE